MITYRDIHRIRSTGYKVCRIKDRIYLVSLYSRQEYDGNPVSTIVKRILSHVYAIRIVKRWI